MHPSLPLLAIYAVNSAIHALTTQVVVPPVTIQGNWEAVDASPAAHNIAATQANRHAYDVLSDMGPEQRANYFIAAFRADALLAAGLNVFDTALQVREAELTAVMETVWKNEMVRLA